VFFTPTYGLDFFPRALTGARKELMRRQYEVKEKKHKTKEEKQKRYG
jgi:hypothetical protein